jgi:hypothetical protein
MPMMRVSAAHLSLVVAVEKERDLCVERVVTMGKWSSEPPPRPDARERDVSLTE